MLYSKIVSVILLCCLSVSVNANMIKDGDFSADDSICALSSSWDSSKHELNKWYSWSDSKKGEFYNNSNGFASIDRNLWDQSTADVKQAKLMQVIKLDEAAAYNLSFDYNISDDARQYSVMRVFGITNKTGKTSKINMANWDIAVSNASYDRLYDQGGKYSYLSSTENWKHVEANFEVNKPYDYVVIYAAFSYDGLGCTADMVGLDNVSVNAIPEPATLLMLGVGFAGLSMSRKFKRTH